MRPDSASSLPSAAAASPSCSSSVAADHGRCIDARTSVSWPDAALYGSIEDDGTVARTRTAMARMPPEETAAARARGIARYELETLDVLESALPDEHVRSSGFG